jgi:hypothetical protein
MTRKTLSLCIILAFAVLILPTSRASASDGTLEGLVADHTGARISRAAVTLLDQRGQQASRTITGPDGAYRVAVPPGIYTLTVNAPGFCILHRAPFQVQPRQTVKFNIELPVCPIIDCLPVEVEEPRPPPPSTDPLLPECEDIFAEDKIEVSADPEQSLHVELLWGKKHPDAKSGTIRYEGFDTGSRLAVILTYDALTIKANEIQVTRDPVVFKARGKVTIQYMGADMNADTATLTFAGTIPLVDAQGMELTPHVDKALVP